MTGKFHAFVLGVIPAVIVVISLVVALTVVQFLIGNFLDPCVMGNSLDLSPFAILVTVLSKFAGHEAA